MWGRVLEILARKAAQGVDVRVMYDGTCEFALLPMTIRNVCAGWGSSAEPLRRSRLLSPRTIITVTIGRYS